jgi:hypothetical protein
VRNLEDCRGRNVGICSSGWNQALQAFTIYFDGRIPNPMTAATISYTDGRMLRFGARRVDGRVTFDDRGGRVELKGVPRQWRLSSTARIPIWPGRSLARSGLAMRAGRGGARPVVDRRVVCWRVRGSR